MRGLSVFYRFSMTIAFFSLPPAILLFPFWGVLAVAGSFSVVAALLLVVMVRSEKILRSYLRAQTALGPHLMKLCERRLGAEGLPEISVFLDPAPQVFLGRAPGSPGSIFISKGMLVLLDDREIILLIVDAAKRLRGPEVLLQSLSVSLNYLLLKPFPRQYRDLIGARSLMTPTTKNGLSVFSFLILLLLLPGLQFLTRMGEFRVSAGERKASFLEPLQTKLKNAQRLWPVELKPELRPVRLWNPL